MIEPDLQKSAQAAYERWRQTASGESPSWASLDLTEWERWVEIIKAAGPIPETNIELAGCPDLTDSSFDWGRMCLDGPPPERCTVLAAAYNAGPLRRLVETFSCAALEVPQGALVTPSTWIMLTPNGMAWSRGHS